MVCAPMHTHHACTHKILFKRKKICLGLSYRLGLVNRHQIFLDLSQEKENDHQRESGPLSVLVNKGLSALSHTCGARLLWALTAKFYSYLRHIQGQQIPVCSPGFQAVLRKPSLAPSLQHSSWNSQRTANTLMLCALC